MTLRPFTLCFISVFILSACSSYEPTYITRNDFYNTHERNDAGQQLVDCLNQNIANYPDVKKDIAQAAQDINQQCENLRETAFQTILQEQVTPGGQAISRSQEQRVNQMRQRFKETTETMIENNIKADRVIKL